MSRGMSAEELANIAWQNKLNDEMVKRYDEDSEAVCALSPLTIARMGVEDVNALLTEVMRLQRECSVRRMLATAYRLGSSELAEQALRELETLERQEKG